MSSEVAQPHLSLALTTGQAEELASHPQLVRDLDEVGLAHLIIGFDLVSSDAENSVVAADAHSLTSFLSANIATTPLLSVAVPHRDHPYNIARRAGALDLLSQHPSGVLIGFADRSVQQLRSHEYAWGDEGLGPRIPLSSESVSDAVTVINSLWHAWPFSSVLADRENRVYVEVDQVRPIHHDGIYRVLGPLTAPAAADGFPILAAYVENSEQFNRVAHNADLVVVKDQQLIRQRNDTAASPRLLVQETLVGDTDVLDASRLTTPPGADGLLLSLPQHSIIQLHQFITTLEKTHAN